MRVLLDENLPIDLASHLTGHEVETVLGFGWGGVKNGELLRRTQGRFDAFITMDRSIQFQQPIARQPFGVLVLVLESTMKRQCDRLILALGEQRAPFVPAELKGNPWTVKKKALERYGHFEISAALWHPIEELLAVRNVLVHENGAVDPNHARRFTMEGIRLNAGEIMIESDFVQNAFSAVRALATHMDECVRDTIDRGLRAISAVTDAVIPPSNPTPRSRLIMHFGNATVAALTMVLTLAAPGASQSIGSVALELGASRATVVSALQEHFLVDSTGAVFEKVGPPHRPVGSVEFSGGRLTFVARAWVGPDSDAHTFSMAAVDALSQMDGHGGCHVQARRSVEPGRTIEIVEVTCGTHTIQFMSGMAGNRPMTRGVWELWRAR